MASMEMIDLIQRNLEQDGILAKIRAQLLASVVNILNGNERKQPPDMISSFLDTDQGNLCFQLVADLLSTLKLSATLSVFLGECGMEYTDKTRFQISDSLGVALADHQPIMASLLERGISSQSKLSAPSPFPKSEEKVAQKSSPSHKAEEKEKLMPPNDNKSPDYKQSHSEKQSHSQTLKPVSNSRHRKGHLENDHFADSDLEASTSSVSSITSIGSSKGGKGLAPLGPLGSHGKSKDPLGHLPNPSSSGLKHLNPLAPLGHGHLPQQSFPSPPDKLSSLSGQRKLSPTLDKLHSNSGGHLEHSFDDERGVLSPYDGNRKGKEIPTDELEFSVPDSIQESASFEESSKVSEDFGHETGFNKNTSLTGKPAISKVEVAGKLSSNSTPEDSPKGLLTKANVTQSSAQVTRSTKGWDDSPEKDLQIETSYVSEYPESFEESVASDSEQGSPLKETERVKPGASTQPLKTIDDLLSDDEEEESSDHPETTPTTRGSVPQSDEDEFNEVRSSRADSVDTVSRQKPSSLTSREAFSSSQPHNQSKSQAQELLSPVDGDEEDEIYGQLDESIQLDDPSHSAVLDESGDHVHEEDQHDLNQSRRSNQEDEDDYRQVTQSSAIKKSLFSSGPGATGAVKSSSPTLNPNDLSNKSEEDEYFDDDFEDSDHEQEGDEEGKRGEDRGHQRPAPVASGGVTAGEEEEGSYVESLEEDIESIEEEDENNFSYGGASSGDEDMLTRGEKKKDQLPADKAPFGSSRGGGGGAAAQARNLSTKYDHNSSDDEDLYIPASSTSRKTIAKTDENSDDDQEGDVYQPSGKSQSGLSGSLFGQKKVQPKYDDNSDHEEDNDVPETGSASDFSAGGSDGEASFLHEESVDLKGRGLGERDSNEFSMSEQEISGSHILDDGFDYTTNALPPGRRFGGR